MPSLFRGEFEAARTGVAKGVSGAISVTTQVALAAGVISISGAMGPSVVRVPAQRLTFVSVEFVPPPPVELAPPPAEAVTKPAVPREVKTREPAPELPKLVAVQKFENHALPTPAPSEVRPAEVRTSRPLPEPPKPVVGAFNTVASVARSPEPVRRVESAGFNVPVAESRQVQPAVATVGAFNTASTTGGRQPGTASSGYNIVVETAFNQPTAAAPVQQNGVVRNGGFNDARVVEPVRRAETAPQRQTVVPVEVLSKPKPFYTDEARRLKIEGEVVLEVEFLTNGSVRVVKVVRGLGFGLDESATAAAQRIQFKPATSEGRAIDFRTTVQIVFRLA